MNTFMYSPYAWLDDIRRDFGYLTGGMDHQWTPAVDLAEDDSGYFVTVDLPGVNPDDVDITTHQGLLRIKGKRDWEVSERRELSNERWRGEFERQFTLPKYADVDRIDAKYKNGVLAIYLPKLAQAEPKRIAINVH